MCSLTAMSSTPRRTGTTDTGEILVFDTYRNAESALATALQGVETAFGKGQIPSERWTARSGDANWLTFERAMNRFNWLMRARNEKAEQVLVRVKRILGTAAPSVAFDSILGRTIVSQCIRSYFSS